METCCAGMHCLAYHSDWFIQASTAPHKTKYECSMVGRLDYMHAWLLKLGRLEQLGSDVV